MMPGDKQDSTKKRSSCESTSSARGVQRAAGAAARENWEEKESVFEVREWEISKDRHEKASSAAQLPELTKDNSPVFCFVYIK